MGKNSFVGGEAILEVTRSANSAEAKIDDDGQYYIDLGDFISKVIDIDVTPCSM